MARLAEETKVQFPEGLHLRPSEVLAYLSLKFSCEVYLIHNEMRINGKSIMSILTLGAGCGVTITIDCDGEDAEEAVAALLEFFDSDTWD